MSNAETISLREYGRRVGVSDTAVRKAIKAGKIVNGVVRDGNGSAIGINPEVANAEWSKNYDPNYQRETRGGSMPFAEASKPEPRPKTPPPSASDPLPDEKTEAGSLAAIKRAQAVYKLKQAKLDYEKASGRLVDKDMVFRSLYSAGQEMRTALQSVPDRCIDEILAATNRNEAHTILYEEITKTLERLVEIYNRGLNEPEN